MIGLEPITCWLQISCSANWATSAKISDSDGNWTRVTAVKGRCLNLLTTEPYRLFLFIKKNYRQGLNTLTKSTFNFTSELSKLAWKLKFNSPSWVWTNDPSVNSRMLCRWAIEEYRFERSSNLCTLASLTTIKFSQLSNLWRLYLQNRTLIENFSFLYEQNTLIMKTENFCDSLSRLRHLSKWFFLR